MMLRYPELALLRRIARGERLSYPSRSRVLERLELLGLVQCWPGEQPKVTEQGAKAIEALS